ncbi:MAG: hypothetical protein V8T87_03915 [Victivallales bacterium]
MPEAEPDFYFADGEWHSACDELPPDWFSCWDRELRREFILPEDSSSSPREWLGCLLTERPAASDDVRHRFRRAECPAETAPSEPPPQPVAPDCIADCPADCQFRLGDCRASFPSITKSILPLSPPTNRLRTQVTAAQRKLKTAEKELRSFPCRQPVGGKLRCDRQACRILLRSSEQCDGHESALNGQQCRSYDAQ